MKNLITAALTIALVMSFGFGQEIGTATVSASVLANLSLSSDANVNFGNIPASGTPTIDPLGATHIDVGSAVTVGVFSLTGAPSTVVTLDFPGSVTLGDGSTNTMTFNTDLRGHEDTQASATSVTTTATIGASGGYKFWLGGDLGTLTNQAVATYTSGASNGSGDFTLTIEYQ